MIESLRQEGSGLLLWLVLALGLGLFLGHPGWWIAGAALLYTGRHLQQLGRLREWLSSADKKNVPEAEGVWGELFDHIHHLQEDERQARDNLLGIISRARESISALREAVLLVDGNGNLEWWNPAAEQLLGLKTPADIGQPVINLVRDPQFIAYMEQDRHDAPLVLPSFLHPSHYLQFSITRFGQNDSLIIVQDVTRLHNLEQMRKDFVANVSHELRTPLTVISGYLETLLTQEDAPARWQRPLQQMQQQANRMNALVNDLLMLSRLENEGLPREHSVVDVPALLTQLQHEAQAYGAEKHQRIDIDAQAHLKLLGVASDLRSAFSNLITNAVKYTPDGGVIRIHWSEKPEGLVFSVQDNGIGIDAKHLPRLTERFYRADAARSTATGGTGLGLAIVKHVLIEHDAVLNIQSTLGKGSSFSCVFPLQRKVSE